MIELQILIPTYNCAGFIGETIASVLSQSYSEFEIVVVDNASTDNTENIVKSFFDKRVKYLRNITNIGAIGNHNLCLDILDATYIKILSADDVLMPGILKKQVDALNLHPNVGVVSCNCIVTDASLTRIGEATYLNGYWKGEDAVNKCVRKVANLIGAPSNTMLRTSIIKNIRFDSKLKWYGDLDFACQLLLNSDYLNIDDYGFYYRRHEKSDSVLGCNKKVRFQDEFKFVLINGSYLFSFTRVIFRYARAFIFNR